MATLVPAHTVTPSDRTPQKKKVRKASLPLHFQWQEVKTPLAGPASMAGAPGMFVERPLICPILDCRGALRRITRSPLHRNSNSR
ncbi:UNVERIFIED_CONTAM: hypothetical protein Slati_3484600 [Sesamum latifolium]|uniref:Uncharacterized protein n=1 Tax=Sesamum latifolium TaxID=2727402 RepID=A0AAW2UIN0_9LAMI